MLALAKEKEKSRQSLSQLGVKLVLLFNRGFMYQPNHPSFVEGVDTTFQAFDQNLWKTSPLVFMLNREQFYMDEALVNPRISTQKLLSHFNKKGIESISFYQGLKRDDLRVLLEVATAPNNIDDAVSMGNELYRCGVETIRINHVVYRKVTANDEVISRGALKKLTPHIMNEAQGETKHRFLDVVLESVLAEEFEKTLNFQTILKGPESVSEKMIAADLKLVKRKGDESQRPGQFLLQELELVQREVEDNLSEKGASNLPELASALFDMRQKLIEGMEAQKAVGIAYENEALIRDKTNVITDRVLIKLVREEYKSGRITAPRLAHILRRLIPEAGELKRLLPQIRTALFEEGMEGSAFLLLLQSLNKELQSDELASLLTTGSEQIGVEGEEIIEELKAHPLQSAELLYLASQIRKDGMDEKGLTDLLVNYVERAGSKMSRELSRNEKGGEEHLQQITTEIKSNLISHLEKMDVRADVLVRLEERLNQRMDDILGKMTLEWLASQSVQSEKEPAKRLTLLETLEYSVKGEEELAEILAVVRAKVQSGEISENDFGEIYAEIARQEKSKLAKQDDLPAGIMRTRELMTLMDKEIARVKRYNVPFSALGFSLVKVRPKGQAKPVQMRRQDVIDAVLRRLSETFRTCDVVGEVKANRLIALLPMTDQAGAKLALKRAMRLLNVEPVDVGGTPIEVKVAGVVADLDLERTPNALQFAHALSDQLTDMANRIRTIHTYF
jgi:hypothetical protein